MDIPAQARWRVERADETGFALSGTGPMGITLGLWATLAAEGRHRRGSRCVSTPAWRARRCAGRSG